MIQNHKINYSKFVYSSVLNKDIVKEKIGLVEDWKKTNKPELFDMILKDKTMFAYAFLTLNNNPLELYYFQDAIINDPHKYIYARTGRQMGKSIGLDVDATRNLCVNHGYGFNECIISANLSQATFQMRRIKSMLSSAKFDYKSTKGATDNMSVITIDIKGERGEKLYTNMLVVVPCSEAARGYDFHQVYLDEFEYWQDVDMSYMYNSVIEPTTFHTGGSIMICTTPNGMDSFGADLERLTLPNGKKKFHTYVFDYMDVPGRTELDLEERKLGRTRQQIESEIMAIRSISDRNYFSPDEIEKSHDKEVNELKMVDKQTFFFLDVGAKHDQSVLCGGYVELNEDTIEGRRPIKHIYVPIIKVYPVGYPLSRVVGSTDANQDSDGWHSEKSVKDYLVEWSKGGKQPVFGCDVTGNTGISPLFKTVGINPLDITFSGPVKSGMYQRLKYFMEKGLLHRIKCKEFDYQFAHMEMKKSARGYLTIHHESENDLDDVPDSIAGLVHLADNPNIVPVTLTVIGETNEQ